MPGGIEASMNRLTKFIDLILYSNLWIALAAVGMCWQSEFLLFGAFHWSPYTGFVLAGTLFLYAAHRLFGLTRVQPFRDTGRYQVIARYRRHIALLALFAAGAGSWYYFQLPFFMKWQLIIPCLIGLTYVAPVLGGSRRLRDLPYVKIFLIAIAWAWLTAILPAAARSWALTAPALLITLERGFFIFALTLPFDVRDLQVDAYTEVRTLPAHLGMRRTRLLAVAALAVMLLCSWLNYRLATYTAGTLAALHLSALLSYALIYFADRVDHDYYFSGALDGMLLLQFLLVVWWA